MSDDIKIRLIEHGETTAEVPADVYASAKAAGELDQLFDCEASDIDTTTVVVEPDGTRVDYSTGQPIVPPKAGDLPVGSVVATARTAYAKVAVTFGPPGNIVWYGTNDDYFDGDGREIDAMLASGVAKVLRVGTGEAS